MTRRRSPISLLALYAGAAALFLVLPELVVVAVSFTPTERMVMPTTTLSWRWYEALWAHQEMLRAFALSFAIAPAVTLVSLLLSGTAAYAATRLGRRRAAAVQGMFVAPLLVPAAALGVALFLLLHGLGLTETIWGVCLGHLVISLPYTFRALLAALAGMDRALEEAALSLGANRLAVIRRVTIPLIRPAIMAAALFSFIVSLDEFTLTLFIGGRSVRTIPIAIFAATEYGMDPKVAAASTVLIVISGIVIVLLEKSVGLTRAYAVRR